MDARVKPEHDNRKCGSAGESVEAIYEWFRQFYQDTGINLTFIYDSYDRGRLIDGFWMTVWLSLICLALSVAIGIVGAWAQGARSALLRRAVAAYIAFFRSTPPLEIGRASCRERVCPYV